MKRTLIILLAALAYAAATAQSFVYPKSVPPGSTVGLVTAASAVDSLTVVKAVEKLEQRGYHVKIMPGVFGSEYGSFAVNDTLRAAAIMQAFVDPEVDFIMSTRGGYGCNRIVNLLDTAVIAQNPKWFVGYSDISVLHALFTRMGLASIHGPMCGHIADNPYDDDSVELLFRILQDGPAITYRIDSDPRNLPGVGKGILVGGNMITVNDLAETAIDIFNYQPEDGIILFVEDVGEKIHAIERILVRMHESGILDRLNGLIIGEFTSYKPNDDFESMEDMISHWLREWGYADKNIPVMFGFPAGHGEVNYPLVMGSHATLDVNPVFAKLSMK